MMISYHGGDRMSYLSDMKFNVVKREATDAAGIDEAVKRWTRDVESGRMDVPVERTWSYAMMTLLRCRRKRHRASCYESRFCFQVAG